MHPVVFCRNPPHSFPMSSDELSTSVTLAGHRACSKNTPLPGVIHRLSCSSNFPLRQSETCFLAAKPRPAASFKSLGRHSFFSHALQAPLPRTKDHSPSVALPHNKSFPTGRVFARRLAANTVCNSLSPYHAYSMIDGHGSLPGKPPTQPRVGRPTPVVNKQPK